MNWSMIDSAPLRIAELRFPHDQRVRCRDAVSVFEAEDAYSEERAVIELERRACAGRCWMGV